MIRKQKVFAALRQFFRPEFLNRVDDIVVFEPLNRKDLIQIVDIQLARFIARMKQLQMTIKITENAKAALAEEGYDPIYGARPLKRTISQRFETPISRMIIAETLQEDGTLEVDHRNGDYQFHPS